jgi:hypothetical protein
MKTVRLLVLGMALLTPLWGSGTLAAGLPPQRFVSCNHSQVIGKEKDEQGNMVRSKQGVSHAK